MTKYESMELLRKNAIEKRNAFEHDKIMFKFWEDLAKHYEEQELNLSVTEALEEVDE